MEKCILILGELEGFLNKLINFKIKQSNATNNITDALLLEEIPVKEFNKSNI